MRSDAAWIGPLRQHGHAVAVQMRCDTVNRVRLAHARSRVPQGAGDEQAHAVFDQVHQLLDGRRVVHRNRIGLPRAMHIQAVSQILQLSVSTPSLLILSPRADRAVAKILTGVDARTLHIHRVEIEGVAGVRGAVRRR